VIACHTEKREKQIRRAVASVLSQDPAPVEVVLVVDHNESLRARLHDLLPGVAVVPNRFARGASGARNTGAAAATTGLVAFLDDDAAAEPGWLAGLLDAVERPGVVGAGGFVAAEWSSGAPGWFPGEFNWVVGASYDGSPTTLTPVRNGWAENMIVRRDAFAAVGGFRTGFGKLGAHSRPEDTDLCIRLQESGGSWLFQPAAVVLHAVPAERSTVPFFLRRCWHEGRGKADLERLLGDPAAARAEERGYVRVVLPRGLARHLARAARTGRPVHLARAGMLVAGLVATLAGYGWQRACDLRRGPVAPPEAARIPSDDELAAAS